MMYVFLAFFRLIILALNMSQLASLSFFYPKNVFQNKFEFLLHYLFFQQVIQGSSTQYVRTKGEGKGKAKCVRFFFVQKKLLHCHLLLCIEKSKPALSYKQKP